MQFWYIRNSLFLSLVALAAYLGGTLFPWQMPSHPKPVPLVCHGGAISDVFLMPVILKVIMTYRKAWASLPIKIWLALSFLGAIGWHAFYIADAKTNPVWLVTGNHLSVAGNLHYVYMSLIMALPPLFYYHTKIRVAPWDARLASFLLWLHVIFAAVGPAWYTGRPLWNFATAFTVLGAGTAILTSYLCLRWRQR